MTELTPAQPNINTADIEDCAACGEDYCDFHMGYVKGWGGCSGQP